MKKIIISLLILFISIGCLGNTYSQLNNDPNYKYRIGYSTKYGNSFNQNVMPPSYQMYGTYNKPYTGGYSPITASTPRKSPQRPDPNNDDGDDWRMNDDYSTWQRIWGAIFDNDYESYDSNWPSYVEPDYWEWFLENYPEYKDYVEQWFEQHPDAPNNPFKTPIGDNLVLLIFLALWCIYKNLKNDRLYRTVQKWIRNPY